MFVGKNEERIQCIMKGYGKQWFVDIVLKVRSTDIYTFYISPSKYLPFSLFYWVFKIFPLLKIFSKQKVVIYIKKLLGEIVNDL